MPCLTPFTFSQIHQSLLNNASISAAAKQLNILPPDLGSYLRACTTLEMKNLASQLNNSAQFEIIKTALGPTYFEPIHLGNAKIILDIKTKLDGCLYQPQNNNIFNSELTESSANIKLSLSQIHQSMRNNNLFSVAAKELGISPLHLQLYLRTCTFDELKPFVLKLRSMSPKIFKKALGETYHHPITLNNSKLLNDIRSVCQEYTKQYRIARETARSLREYLAVEDSSISIDQLLNQKRSLSTIDNPSTPTTDLVDEEALENLLTSTENYVPTVFKPAKKQKVEHNVNYNRSLLSS